MTRSLARRISLSEQDRDAALLRDLAHRVEHRVVVDAEPRAATARIRQDDIFIFAVGPRAEAGDLHTARTFERSEHAEPIEIACASRVDQLTAERWIETARVRLEDDDARAARGERHCARQSSEAASTNDDVGSLHPSSASRVCDDG